MLAAENVEVGLVAGEVDFVTVVADEFAVAVVVVAAVENADEMGGIAIAALVAENAAVVACVLLVGSVVVFPCLVDVVAGVAVAEVVVAGAAAGVVAGAAAGVDVAGVAAGVAVAGVAAVVAAGVAAVVAAGFVVVAAAVGIVAGEVEVGS